MVTRSQRAAILVILLLFVAASLGSTGFVVWQMWQDGQENSISSALTDIQQEENNEPQEGSLKGTKLANYEPVDTVNELQTIDLIEGDGAEAAADSTVTAHYTGALAKDGTIFESSKDSGQPATFPLSQVIQGWQQGVPGMKVGGTRRLIIPAALAYGEAGSLPAIGPNEPLVFDIELVSLGE